MRKRPGDRHKGPRERANRKRGPSKPRRYKSLNEAPCVGIDGEGQGRAPHIYTYLAAVDEYGEVLGAAENRQGLSTRECLEMLVNLPCARAFAYSFRYDLTMMLRDLPDRKLWLLFHPDARLGKHGPRSVYWAEFKLNYVGKRFTIADKNDKKKRITIWDVFSFYSEKFVGALKNWKIADESTLERMGKMKDQRADFDRLDWGSIKRYCQSECMHLAELVRRLIVAHENVGLDLQSFHGAGSTASALLTKWNVRESIKAPPKAAQHAVACAFFGGRFEISRAGPVKGPVYGYDISSAYPYQTTFLPCLIHGTWERHTTKLQARIERARLACVRATVRAYGDVPWGPLPWRHEDGTILFPTCNGGGVWVWRDEFLTAQAGWDGVRAKEVWTYDTHCDCAPFSHVPRVYRERVQLGKDGPGIVLKLGANSLYGKLAQHRGSSKFQSYVFAGNITSGTRAQLCALKVPTWDVLMYATDGVWTRKRIKSPPTPRDTGTSDLSKPLGGWEEKVYPAGVFLVRPGIYFPLSPTKEELKEVRSRGIAKAVLLDNADRIVEAWERSGPHGDPVEIQRTMFAGAKTCVQKNGEEFKRRDYYGDWIQVPIKVSFDARPKRERFERNRLILWQLPNDAPMSTPYSPALVSPEARAMREEEEMMLEQPHADYVGGV